MQRKAILLISIVALVSLTGCQNTKYVERSSLQAKTSISPTVNFTKAANFDFNSLNCIAVGNITVDTASKDFPTIDKAVLIRAAVYGHLASKRYRDVETARVDFIFNKYTDLPQEQILNKLNCDALLTGEITKFENKYLVAYSVTSVGLRLRLEHKTEKTIWSSEHVARSSSGALPLSPIGLATGVFLATNNAEDETAYQMIDAVVRRSLKALPDRDLVDLVDSIVEIPVRSLPKDEVLLADSDPIEDALTAGDYEKALALYQDASSQDVVDASLYYQGGRALLALEKPKEAVDNFYQAIALGDENDIYFEALGVAHIKSGNTSLALAAFEKAIGINEKNSFAYFNAAIILENEKRHANAVNFYHAAGMAGVLAEDYNRVRQSIAGLNRLASSFAENEKRAQLERLFAEQWPTSEKDLILNKVDP